MTTDQTILLVEDNNDLRRLFQRALIFEGYRVLTTAHGGEALQVLNRETPAAVVLDLVLPWVNGLEVLARMRDTARLRDVPVVVVTGTPTTPYELRDFRPVMLLHKPLSVHAISRVIRQVLRPSSK